MSAIKKTMREFPIVSIDAMENDACLEFNLYQNGRPYYAFLVKQNSRFFAYANSCPHQGRMLQWMPNRFLTKDKQKIMCGAHGATFEVETGLCDAGPCRGASLRKLALKIEDEVVVVSLADS